jgi:hypothetical protein
MVSNQEKVMIIRKKKCCKPRKIKVCKKKSQKISTHHLTVLIMSVILRIEQKINGYLNIDKYPFVKEERV